MKYKFLLYYIYMNIYQQKYLKYKNKYLTLQEHKMMGGGRKVQS